MSGLEGCEKNETKVSFLNWYDLYTYKNQEIILDPIYFIIHRKYTRAVAKKSFSAISHKFLITEHSQ